MALPRPSSDYVRTRLAGLRGDPQFDATECVVGQVFAATPTNDHLEGVLLKVAVLNQLYSTQIYAVHDLAAHITRLNIDARLKAGDASLIDDIARLPIGGKVRHNLSFATKYCSWHAPAHFQIYDSLVDTLLWEYRKHFAFADFRRKDLKDYSRYLEIHQSFRSHFDLQSISRKEIDRFLWFEAKQQGLGG